MQRANYVASGSMYVVSTSSHPTTRNTTMTHPHIHCLTHPRVNHQRHAVLGYPHQANDENIVSNWIRAIHAAAGVCEVQVDIISGAGRQAGGWCAGRGGRRARWIPARIRIRRPSLTRCSALPRPRTFACAVLRAVCCVLCAVRCVLCAVCCALCDVCCAVFVGPVLVGR